MIERFGTKGSYYLDYQIVGSGVRKIVGFLRPIRIDGQKGGLSVWSLRLGRKELRELNELHSAIHYTEYSTYTNLVTTLHL